jgi:hypothetical protein
MDHRWRKKYIIAAMMSNASRKRKVVQLRWSRIRMGILTDDMKRIVREQRLGYVATVCPDGTPNLSPKGTTAVWDDDHLMFADIRHRNRSRISSRTPPSKSMSSIRSFAKGIDSRGGELSIAPMTSSNEGAGYTGARESSMKSERWF